jgi:pilus assembly protein CpaF
MTPRPPAAARDGRIPLGGENIDPALVEKVRRRLLPARVDLTAIMHALRAEGSLLDGQALAAEADRVQAELTGAGVLEPLLRDRDITDILVNAPDAVWIERNGTLQRSATVFRDEPAVRRLAQRLASQAGRRLDDASPCVDAVLPNGVRLHAVLPPVAARSTLMSLRIPPRRVFTLDGLVDTGMLTHLGAQLLAALARQRVSYLIAGGTGTGKTTVLGTMVNLAPRGERLVLVEDCAEAVIRHPHVVRLQSRTANQEGIGGIGLGVLVRQALRMRPDRVVVGEVRGVEVCDLLKAMNTGHEGGCATVHANGVEDVPARVEALASPAGLARAAVHAQLAAAVRVVLHLERGDGGRRRLACVGVLTRDAEGWVRVEPAVTFGPDGAAVPGRGAARLSELLGIEIRDGAPRDSELDKSVKADPGGRDNDWPNVLRDADRMLPALPSRSPAAALPAAPSAPSLRATPAMTPPPDDDPSRDPDPPLSQRTPKPDRGSRAEPSKQGSRPESLAALVKRVRADAESDGDAEPFVADYGPSPFAVSGGTP